MTALEVADDKKIDADNKTTCYFKAHDCTFILVISREATDIDLIMLATMQTESWSTNIAPLVQQRAERRQLQRTP